MRKLPVLPVHYKEGNNKVTVSGICPGGDHLNEKVANVDEVLEKDANNTKSDLLNTSSWTPHSTQMHQPSSESSWRLYPGKKFSQRNSYVTI